MKRTIAAAAVLVASGLASAQGTGMYIGASVGEGRVDLDNVARDAATEIENELGIPVVATSEDDSDTVYKLFVGYKYNPNFAVEGGYATLGKYDAKVVADFLGDPLTAHAEVKGKAFFLDAVGILPLSPQFSLFGKLGAAYAKTKMHVEARVLDIRESDSDSDSEWVPKAGVGAEFALTKTVGLRAEYERYFDVGDEDKTGESDVDVLTIGLTVGF